MSNIEVKVIEDSISPTGQRLTTLQMSFPRFILPEFNTHRVFSRNFSSSRAIPVKKMIDMIRNSPARPIHWGENQAGMQASVELSDEKKVAAKLLWSNAAKKAADIAEAMMDLGLHKQVANRVLEPFMMVNGIVTATEYDNWFDLRAHEDAQPEIHELALQMRFAMNESRPKLLDLGEWHLPYVTLEERNDSYFKDKPELLRKVSAARCCRVSYLKHDGSAASIQDDLDLCKKLAGAVPIHASPFEHQATPDEKLKEAKFGGFDGWTKPYLHGNLVGWIQYRKQIELSFKS